MHELITMFALLCVGHMHLILIPAEFVKIIDRSRLALGPPPRPHTGQVANVRALAHQCGSHLVAIWQPPGSYPTHAPGGNLVATWRPPGSHLAATWHPCMPSDTWPPDPPSAIYQAFGNQYPISRGFQKPISNILE